jgi:hypothetical protein
MGVKSKLIIKAQRVKKADARPLTELFVFADNVCLDIFS